MGFAEKTPLGGDRLCTAYREPKLSTFEFGNVERYASKHYSNSYFSILPAGVLLYPPTCKRDMIHPVHGIDVISYTMTGILYSSPQSHPCI